MKATANLPMVIGDSRTLMTNKLYYGDNLGILREHVADESVDLIYLDPPFNSNATYNVLFKAPGGEQSPAQIEAFDDTWHWGELAEDAYWQVLHGPNTDAAQLLESMRKFLGENDMMAYLAMMAVRLLELHRVLKKTGSLYLHCDPTASHYLRILLDSIFGPKRFVNEIAWKRSSAHSDSKQGSKHFGRTQDRLLFYSKSDDRVWNPQYSKYSEEYIERDYRRVDPDGRRHRLDNIQGPGGAAKGNPKYEVMGVTRYWRFSKLRMQALIDAGLIVQTRPGAVPLMKRYLDEMPGVPAQGIWTDIPLLNNRSKEALGYPTQKPVALLERIIAASSKEGDIVLDPFCGCGTTVHAAQKLKRRWIGIDITHLAVGLIERRLRDAFGKTVKFETIGVPRDLDAAKALAEKDKYEFQKWAISLIPDAQPFRGGKKGSDTGIDGIIFLKTGKSKTDKAIVEVKGGAVSVDQIHKLKSVIDREKALVGIFLTLSAPTKPMEKEAMAAGFSETAYGRIPSIQILAIDEILTFRKAPRLPVVDTTAFKKARPEDDSENGELGL